MKPHFKSISKSPVLGILISLFLICSPAWAILWDGGGGDDLTSTGANWNPDAVPGAGDTVPLVFGADAGDNVVTVDLAFSALTGLDFTDADGIFTIGETGAGDLGFGADKIITNPVAFTHVINSSMTSAGLTFNLANDLTVGGAIGGTTITKSGVGILTLSGDNGFTGATNITAGTLAVTANNALGTNAAGTTVANGATLDIQNIAYSTTEALTVDGGTISTSTGTSSFAGAVTLGAASTIGVAGTQLTLSGIIDDGGGTFGLTKTGDGIAVLSGVNAYDGATTINAGTLRIAADSGLGDAPGGATEGHLTFGGGTLETTADMTLSTNRGIALTGAGTIDVDAGTTLTYDGIIAGASTLTKADTGTLSLGGTNTYNNGTTFNAGTIILGADAALGTGTLTLGGAGTLQSNNDARSVSNLIALGGNALTVSGASNLTLSGVISGAGAGSALTKAGAGTLTLSGVNTYDGLTNITAGTLTGAFTVAGNLTVATGGTLAPGSSIGTDIILGNYLLEEGGTLEVEVEKTSSGTLRSDLLDVTGTATLEAGSTINVLDITPAGRLIGTGDTFNIIEADGVITDGGPTITDNSAVLSFAGLVSGTNYQLLATRAAFALNVSGGNNSAVLGAIDSDLASASGDYITLINALTALNSAQLNDAAEQLNPLPHASATLVSTITTQRMAGNLANYLSARRSGIESLTTLNTQSRESQLLIADASSDPQMLAQVIRKNKRIAKKQQDEMDSQIKGFFRPFGVLYEHDSTPKMTGFRAKAVGAQFGFDKSFGLNLVAGIGGGYTHSFINFKQGRGESDIDSYRVGPYATYYKDNFFIDTSASVGLHENENERNIKFGTINRTAKSDYHAWDLSGYIGGGYNFHPVKDWTLTPTTSFQYIRYRNEGFKETGAGAAGLNVDAATSQSLRGKLGVTLSTITELYKTKIVPEVFVGWAHEFMDDEDIKARFVRGTAKFTTDVDDEWDDSVYYGAGVSALLKENISAFARYEGEYSSGNDIKALHVGLTFRF